MQIFSVKIDSVDYIIYRLCIYKKKIALCTFAALLAIFVRTAMQNKFPMVSFYHLIIFTFKNAPQNTRFCVSKPILYRDSYRIFAFLT